MKKSKHGMIIVAVIIAGLIIVQGLYAGGSRDQSGASGGPVRLTVMLTNSVGNDTKILRNTGILERETNTILDFIEASTGDDYTNKLTLVMASGDIPDLFAINTNAHESLFVSEGILLPLNQHWDRYPNIRSSRSESVWQVMTHPDGNVYAVGRAGRLGEHVIEHSYWMVLYRQDWLTRANMSIPRTLDEYWRFCEFIRDGNPNGDGSRAYAIIGDNGLPRSFEHIFSAYGTQYDNWYVKDGRVVHGNVQPEMREGIRYAARMYAAGFVDPEWVTDSQQRHVDKLQHGMIGAGMSWGHNLDPNNTQGYREIFKRNVPHGEYAFGDQLLTTPGYTPFGYLKGSPRGWTRTAIYSRGRNVEAALRVLDFSSSAETIFRNNYGFEGETYTINPDGSINFFATVAQQQEIGLGSYMQFINLTMQNQHASRLYQDVLLRNNELLAPTSLHDIHLVPEIAQYGGALEMQKEQVTRFIIGDLDINNDAHWNNYVADWERRGGRIVADALTRAYQAQRR